MHDFKEGNLPDTVGQLHVRTHRDCSSTHIRPLLSQERPNPSMERAGGHIVPPLAKKLLENDSCGKREG